MAELKVFSAISSINTLLREGRSIPLSGLVAVNRQRIEQLLNDVEAALPEEMERAEKLLSREKELLAKIESQRVETENKANSEARKTVDDANRQAEKTIREANEAAEITISNARITADETVRHATEHANQMILGAQEHVKQLIEKAQADAQRLVAEDNITLNAKKYASDIQKAAQLKCEQMHNETMDELASMIEEAEASMSAQMESLRTLREQLGLEYTEEGVPSYDESVYPDATYSE